MKPYAKLRGKMRENDVTGEMLANYLGHCTAYVSYRLSKSKSWSVDEAYKILEFLEIPKEEFFTYFPPNGGLPVKQKAGK